MIIFGKTVYVGYDQNKYNQIKKALAENNIEYKSKTNDDSAIWLGAGTTRGMGGNINCSNNLQYELIVASKDIEQVQKILFKINQNL